MNIKHSRFVLCGVAWATLSATAHAQSEAPQEEAVALEEIVVTAQKREENLQDAPLAITAVSADALADAGVRQIQQLQNIAPSVQIQDVASSPHISVRGIMGVGQGASLEQPLAMYTDGSYLPRPQSYAGTFFDIERLEVLLGPQGTLYGRNAVSGVLNVISRKPDGTFSGNGDLEIGNYNLRRLEGGVNVPFTDALSGRIAVMTNDRDGYFDNDTGNVDEKSARATLQFKPDDTQRFLVIGDYEKIKNNGQSGARKGQSGEAGAATIYSSTNPNVTIPEEFNNTFAYAADGGTFYDSKQFGVTAQYDYKFEPATLTVIGSYRKLESDSLYNDGFTLLDDGSVYDITLSQSIANFNLKTLEVRLTSNDVVPVKWVAGLYGLNQDSDGSVSTFGGSDSAAAYAAYQSGAADLVNANPYDRSKAYAAFADATWTPDALSQLHLTAGVRYSRDEKEGTTSRYGTLAGTTETHSDKQTSSAVTWRFAPSYDFNDNSMVYLSVSRGYEAGGFAFAPAGQDPSYDPQYVTAYEVGSKNQFLDNRLRLNWDAYYYDYKDQQYIYGFTTPSMFGPPVVSVGITNFDAQYWGSSLQLQAALTRVDMLTFDLAYAYGKSGGLYVRQIESSLQDIADGERLRSVTPWSANASYAHSFDFSTTMLTPQLMFHYTRYAQQKYTVNSSSASDYVLADGTVVYTDTPDVQRFDFLLSWADVGERWEATAYVRNLTDAYDADGPLNYSPAFSASRGMTTITTAEHRGISPMAPRTFGLMLKARF